MNVKNLSLNLPTMKNHKHRGSQTSLVKNDSLKSLKYSHAKRIKQLRD